MLHFLVKKKNPKKMDAIKSVCIPKSDRLFKESCKLNFFLWSAVKQPKQTPPEEPKKEKKSLSIFTFSLFC